MESRELANLAVKYLTGKTDKDIRKAVLNACLESTDLVTQQTINESVARIKRGIIRADEARNVKR